MKFFDKLFIILLSTITISNQSLLLAHATSNPNTIEEIAMEDTLFEALTNKKATIIMGYMNHCPHCAILKSFFEKLSTKYDNISFFIVNGPKLAFHKKIAEYSNNAFKIPGYPSIAFIKNGKITNVHIGGQTKQLEEKIKKLLV